MIRDNAQAKFDAIGLELTDFNIINISLPEAVEKAIDERASLGILADRDGHLHAKEGGGRSRRCGENPGSMGTFMGIGLGAQAGGILGTAFGSAQNAQNKPKDSKFCPECGAKISATAKFCPECGKNLCRETPARPAENPLEKVRNSVPNVEKN